MIRQYKTTVVLRHSPKNTAVSDQFKAIPTVKKKNPSFRSRKNDTAYKLQNKRPSAAVNLTYPVARVYIVAEKVLSITKHLKDRIPARSETLVYISSPASVVQGTSDIRSSVCLRIVEHCSASIRHGTVKNVHSSILEHLISNGHSSWTEDAFKVFHTVSKRNPIKFRKRLLTTAGAIAISLLEPVMQAEDVNTSSHCLGRKNGLGLYIAMTMVDCEPTNSFYLRVLFSESVATQTANLDIGSIHSP